MCPLEIKDTCVRYIAGGQGIRGTADEGEREECYYTSVVPSGDPRYKVNTWLGVSVQKIKSIFISFYQRF